MATLLHISKSATEKKFALFELGFRPFFLLGGLFACVSVLPWVLSLHGVAFMPLGGGLWWHVHEMIFGFALAIIIGFLLTAAQNWTGVPSATGGLLAMLTLLWLLPRVLLPFVSMDFWWLVMGLDVAAALTAASVLARMVIKAGQWRNAPFVVILLVFSVLNALSYWFIHLNDFASSLRVMESVLWLVAVVMNMMGGRVIAFFTERAGEFTRRAEPKWLLSASNAALLGLAVAFLFESDVPMRIFALMSALLVGYRFSLWGWQASFKAPLLWSLHVSFFSLPLACALLAAGFVRSGALHVFTIAAMSGLIMAMVSRVSLGHTGRSLTTPKGMAVAYVLLVLAALLRVLAVVWTQAYLPLIDSALLLWMLAWLIFLYHYARMYFLPRTDGRPG